MNPALNLFSGQASEYALYRPGYPRDLYDHLLKFVPERRQAWDAATGNGQCAAALAGYFGQVMASDLSEQQLALAPALPNVEYRAGRVEETGYANDSFDLITVAQAYHWFDPQAFRNEATRVGKNGAVIAAWCYQLPESADPELNRLIRSFYTDVTGPYWDHHRRLVDEAYETIEFNYERLPDYKTFILLSYTPDQLIGYFSTWSAVQHYKKAKGEDPLDIFRDWIRDMKLPELIELRAPVFVKMGRITK